jgi:hypothetical protein
MGGEQGISAVTSPYRRLYAELLHLRHQGLHLRISTIKLSLRLLLSL